MNTIWKQFLLLLVAILTAIIAKLAMSLVFVVIKKKQKNIQFFTFFLQLLTGIFFQPTGKKEGFLHWEWGLISAPKWHEKEKKKVREKSRECHNHKLQLFPDPKRKRKPTNPNKHKPNKRTKSTKISSLFPKWGNRNTKRTEKYKNKMTHGKTYNKSPCRISHKATKSKTNTGTTALERSVEQTTGGFKALIQLAYFTLGPDATLNTETHKNLVRIKAPNSVNASKQKHKNQINRYNKQRRVLMANSTVCQSKWKPIVEPQRAKPKTYHQAPTHWLKFYEETVIESEARTAVVQLKSEA